MKQRGGGIGLTQANIIINIFATTQFNWTKTLIEKGCKKYQPVSAISIKASIPSPLSHDQKIVHLMQLFADI